MTGELEARIRALVDEVHDPCSVARGVPLGLGAMGMVEQLSLARRPDGRADVRVVLRLTTPACLYALQFMAQLDERLRAEPDVAEATVELGSSGWSPEAMSAEAHALLARRRGEIIGAARERAGGMHLGYARATPMSASRLTSAASSSSESPAQSAGGSGRTK